MYQTKKNVDKHVSSLLGRVRDEKERNSRGYQIAQMYHKVREYEIAQKYLSMYLSYKDNYAPAHKLMGQISEAVGQSSKAVASYKRAVELDGTLKDVVLKICNIYCHMDVDPGRARYWVERAEKVYPNNDIVFKLKEKIIVSNGHESMNDLENLITSELTKKPKDVSLRIRLLKLYVESGQLSEAYDHACQVEAKNIFSDSLEWYRYLVELLQIYSESNDVLPSVFYIHQVAAVNALCNLSLQYSSAADVAENIFKLDECLQKVIQLDDQPPYLDLVITEMQGQLFYHAGTLILKRAKLSQMNWKEATAQASACYLISYSIDVPELHTPWYSRLNREQSKLMSRVVDMAHYRLAQVGYMLLNLCKGDGLLWTQTIIKQHCTLQGQSKLTDNLFMVKDLKRNKGQTYIATTRLFTDFDVKYPKERDLKEHFSSAHMVKPNNLHDIAWYALQMYNDKDPVQPNYQCQVFADLIYSTRNIVNGGPESLCQLDTQAFLYAVVWCVSQRRRQLTRDPDVPCYLPPSLLEPLCSKEQSDWWTAAYQLYKNISADDFSKQRQILQRGLEVIRCIGNHGIDVDLMVHLAKTFDEQSTQMKANNSTDFVGETICLQSRVIHYWKVALNTIERLMRNESIRQPREHLFQSSGDIPDTKTLDLYYSEGRQVLAVYEMNSGNCDTAIEMLQDVDTSMASYYQAQAYKQLAETEYNSRETDGITPDVKSKYTALMTKSRDNLYTTLEKLKKEPKSKLNATLHVEIEDVETKLNKIEAGLDLHDSDDSCDEEENVQKAHEVSPIIHSTPASGRTRLDSSILEKSSRTRPSPERLDSQIRSLTFNQDRLVKTVMERNEELIETNRLVVEEMRESRKVIEEMRLSAADSRKVIEDLRSQIEKYKLEDAQRQHTPQPYHYPSHPHPTHPVHIPAQALHNYPGYRATPPAGPPYIAPSGSGDYGDHEYNGEEYEEDYGNGDNYNGYDVSDAQLVQEWPYGHISKLEGKATVTYSPQGGPSPATITHGMPAGTYYPPPAAQFAAMTPPKGYHLGTAQQMSGFPQGPPGVLQASNQPKPAPIMPGFFSSPRAPPFSSPVHQAAKPVQSADTDTGYPPNAVIGKTPQQNIQDDHSKMMTGSPLVALSISQATTTPPVLTTQSAPKQSILQGLLTQPEKVDTSVQDLDHHDTSAHDDSYQGPDFEPIIPLPDKVDVPTGEEKETVLFEDRAKLYRFADKQWKERGVGPIKILHNQNTHSVRILMRRDQIHKICANHQIDVNMTLKSITEKAWAWYALDFADEEEKMENFSCRFKTEDIAQKFKDAVEHAKTVVLPRKSLDSKKAVQQAAPVGFGDQFKKKTGTWDCEVCLINNASDQETCQACGTCKPGSSATSATKQISAASGSSLLNINPSGGFTFGSSLTNTPNSTQASTMSGFNLGGFSLNSTSDNNTSSTQSTSGFSLGGFSFGDSTSATSALSALAKMTDNIPQNKDEKTDASKSTFGGFTFTTKPVISEAEKVSQAESIQQEKPKQEKPFSGFTFSLAKPDEKKVETSKALSSFSFVTPPGTTSPQIPKTVDIKNTGLFQPKKEEVSTTSAASKVWSEINSFSGTGKPLFGGGSPIKDNGSPTKDGHDENYEPHADFEPIVPLPDLVDVMTGEEEEESLFGERAKLFRYDTSAKQWKERGIGEMKILKHRKKLNFRILMRREQIHKLCANHIISTSMCLQPMQSSDKAWCWFASDFSEEEVKHEQLAVRFKDKDVALQFKSEFENCQRILSESDKLVEELKDESGEVSEDSEDTNEDTNEDIEEAAGSVGASSFNRLKPKPGSWECNGCYVINDPSDDRCVACATANPSISTSKLQSGDTCPSASSTVSKSDLPDGNESLGTGFTFGASVKDAAPSFAGFSFASSTSDSSKAVGFTFDTSISVSATNDVTPRKPATDNSSGGFKFSLPGSFTFTPDQVTPASKSPVKLKSPVKVPGSPEYYHNEEGEDHHIHFEPIIPLPDKVDIVTGEENENVVFNNHAKLYRFVQGEWKERGLGPMKILENKESHCSRILMRRDQIHKICCNHNITDDLVLKPMPSTKGKAWIWHATDFSEGSPDHAQFAVKFRSEDIANEFNKVFTQSQGTELVTSSDDSKPIPGSTPVKSASEFSFKEPDSTAKLSPFSKSGISAEKSVFGGKSLQGTSPLSNLGKGVFCKPPADDGSNECEVVFYLKPTPGQIAKARKFQLPDTFYLYENKPDCPGCIGCNDGALWDQLLTQESGEVVSQDISSKQIETNVAEPDSTTDKLNLDTSSSSTEYNKADSTTEGATGLMFGNHDTGLSFATLSAGDTPSFTKSDASKPFSWTGAGSTLFGSARDGNDEEDDESGVSHHEPDIHFEPIVPLPDLVEVRTGEEGEEVIYSQRAKIYRYDKDVSQWKERGVGELKLLRNRETGKIRILLRREQVLKVACNHYLTEDMVLNPMASSDKAYCWHAMDFTESEAKFEQFAARFKNEQIANDFKAKFEECQKMLATDIIPPAEDAEDEGENLSVEETLEPSGDQSTLVLGSNGVLSAEVGSDSSLDQQVLDLSFGAVEKSTDSAVDRPSVFGGKSIFGGAASGFSFSTNSSTSGFGSKPTDNSSTTSASGGIFGLSGNADSSFSSLAAPLFGQKPDSTTTSSGNLFGGTSVFGQKSESSTSNSSGGLFGAAPVFGQKLDSSTSTNSGGSLFGAAPVFGEKPDSTARNTSTNLFGAAPVFGQKPESASSGLFGGAAGTTFGSLATSQTQPVFGEQKQSVFGGGSTFGSSTETEVTSVFGQKSGASGDAPSFASVVSGEQIFGQKSGGTSLFSDQAPSGGSLFGSQSATVFGSQQSPQTGGTLFGGQSTGVSFTSLSRESGDTSYQPSPESYRIRGETGEADEEDNDDDEDTVMFEKRATLLYNDNGEFKRLGMGNLKIIEDDDLEAAKITMTTDANQVVCNHIITKEMAMQRDESHKSSSWIATDFATDEANKRQFKAMFGSKPALDDFDRSFNQGVQMARNGDISERNYSFVTMPTEIDIPEIVGRIEED